jgi:hypothetical protein
MAGDTNRQTEREREREIDRNRQRENGSNNTIQQDSINILSTVEINNDQACKEINATNE